MSTNSLSLVARKCRMPLLVHSPGLCLDQLKMIPNINTIFFRTLYHNLMELSFDMFVCAYAATFPPQVEPSLCVAY